MTLPPLFKHRTPINLFLPKPPISLLHSLPPHQNQNPLLSLLQRCATFHQLQQIHAQMLLSGLISDPFAAGRLISSSLSSHPPNLPYSTQILTHLQNPNAFSWNTLIRAYSNTTHPTHSLFLYKQMLRSTTRPDNYTYPLILKTCTTISDLRTGASVLGQALRLGISSDVFVTNAAIHMFAVSGRLDDAGKLFDESRVRDLVSWNTLINAHVQNGNPKEALRVFRRMEMEKVRCDEVTMIGVVSCCSQLQDLGLGRRFHRYVEENGIEVTVRLSNALMDMYVKCGSLEQAEVLFGGMRKRSVVSWTTMIMGYAKFGLLDAARRVFDEMPERDVVPWNALIGGYVQCGRNKEAFALFKEMQGSNMKPDEVTMVTLLSACSQLGALEMGMWVHRYIDKEKLCLNVALGTALIDMYAKCGNIEKAVKIFNEMTERNTLTWTSIICGLASHGHAGDAIKSFQRMTEIGLQPDEITFIGVLSACCHAGLVNEGRVFFSQMRSEYRLLPKHKHYSCMVDLLGRAGLLHEAEELIANMPIEPDAVVWGALFFACRIHGNIALGEKAASRLLKLDPDDGAIYVLLANMYLDANMWDKARKVRVLMKEVGVEKTPGCSSIEVNGMVYEFMARDKSHPERKKIYACLTQLANQMEHSGGMLTIP